MPWWFSTILSMLAGMGAAGLLRFVLGYLEYRRRGSKAVEMTNAQKAEFLAVRRHLDEVMRLAQEYSDEMIYARAKVLRSVSLSCVGASSDDLERWIHQLKSLPKIGIWSELELHRRQPMYMQVVLAVEHAETLLTMIVYADYAEEDATLEASEPRRSSASIGVSVLKDGEVIFEVSTTGPVAHREVLPRDAARALAVNVLRAQGYPNLDEVLAGEDARKRAGEEA